MQQVAGRSRLEGFAMVRLAARPLAGFVQKPFERTTLQTLLEKVLAPV